MRVKTMVCLGWVLVVLLGAATVHGQSRFAGSKVGSVALATGSELVAAGSVEMLHGGAELVVASAETTGHGVRLVLRPVGHAASHLAEASADLVVEISHQVWESARAAAEISGAVAGEASRALGQVVEVVALTGSEVAHAGLAAAAAGASVVGFALVSGGVVIGIVAHDGLDLLLGHRVHP